MNYQWLGLWVLTASLYASPQCYTQGYGDLITSANETSITLKNGFVLPYRTNSSKKNMG